MAGALLLAGGSAILSGANRGAIVASTPPSPARLTVVTLASSQPAIVNVDAAVPSAAAALDREIHRLGERFRGDVGLAVRDVQTGWTSQYREADPCSDCGVTGS